ncbi:MAG TPA: PilC/PilY family type IV pilus protein [Cellvibrio sp.]|nr:PilC/PilY family type IV pilus protein [Cellvibrio sp.]
MLKQYTVNFFSGLLRNFCYGLRAALLLPLLACVNGAYAIPAQIPLYQTQAVTPIMMLNMSTDHQLYFKVYDDYGDLTDTRATIDGQPNPNYLKNTGDGSPDTTYVHNYQYYGYFDSRKCYRYSTSKARFVPTRVVDPSPANLGYCNYGSVTNEWSGNFLNWVTMTRIDVVRKILYGGLRAAGLDTATETVLERAYLPTDAHAYAKYYRKNDLPRLVPAFTVAIQTSDSTDIESVGRDVGITFCNVTAEASGKYSQNSTSDPLIRVARGNYSLWASNERWQCRWGAPGDDDKKWGRNGNDKLATGIQAFSEAPRQDDASRRLSVNNLSYQGEYVVRVEVCKSAALTEENCVQYPSATFRNKPTGLLQKYGETKELSFALITGSHGRNKSGGVLRKNAGDMLDEINTTTDGTFIASPAKGGIINTLNRVRLFGYANEGVDSDPGAYRLKDSCGYGLTSFANGNCSNWGNPQSEIYYESLRYLGGFGPTSGYTWATNEDDKYITGLTHAAWPALGAGPVTNDNYCAPLNILQFNASVNSYDTGTDADYPSISDIGLANTTAMDALTDLIGSKEGVNSTQRFVGKLLGGSGSDVNQLCTAKNVPNLSKVSGTCPDSPRLNGGYGMAGLAKFARDTGLKPKGVTKGVDKNRYGNIASVVRTYGVGLAPSIPKVEVPVPGSTTGKKIIIQPACRNHSDTDTPTNCAIVDFKIVSEKLNTPAPLEFAPITGKGTEGTLYVSWEDSEQGADYDQDMWGVIHYFVSATQVGIITKVLAQSSDKVMGFGYIITGTKEDGFHVRSGVNNFTYPLGSPSAGYCTLSAPNRCTCTATNVGSKYSPCDQSIDGGRKRIFDVGSSSANFLPSPLYYAAKWGGYSRDFEAQNSANLDDAIKTRDTSDSFFYATDPNALALQLERAFKNIVNDIKSAGGVATNNPRLSQDAFLFQTRFYTTGWTGELRAFQFNEDGLLDRYPGGEPIIKATTRENNKIPSIATRKIYTNDMNTSAVAGANYPRASVVFDWKNLTLAQKASLRLASDNMDTTLAEKRALWVQGYDGDEIGNPASTTNLFRSRTDGGLRIVLGDLVNSTPVYVGAEDYGHSRLPGQAGLDYPAYVQKKKESKRELIVVGANDGMVHAFDAEVKKDPTSGKLTPPTLNEKFAYIPQGAYSKLANLTRADYGKTSNPHRYIVDGPIATGDVYIEKDGKKVWRTIIVGTLGAGGRGVYALDVTDEKPEILFEFSETTCKVDTSAAACPVNKFYYPELGYVMGMPVITPLIGGRFAVVFGNGDLAGTGEGLKSSLFVIDIEKPFDINYSKVVTTDTSKVAGTGLSSPEILPNALGQAVAAYAGDLSGYLWHFNLTGATGAALAPAETPLPANWKSDYLLFKATDKDGNKQPIFSPPTLGYNSAIDKLMVYFGTGKYYDTGDNAASATPVHSMYAIADLGVNGTLENSVDRSTLKEKKLVEATPTTSRTEDKSVKPSWKGSPAHNGWYFNFPSKGERTTTMPILVDDKLLFPTLIPNADPCLEGGDSWVMELEATGTIKLKNSTVLEKNVYNKGLILGSVAIGRRKDGNDSVLASDASGNILEINARREPGLLGRQSWRQLR